MAFKEGTFRQDHSGLIRSFTPSFAFRRIEDVPLDSLEESGKKLVLLDVDNTLVFWRSHDIAEPVLNWLADAKRRGLQLCILSNTRNVARLSKLADQLDIPYLRDKFKPSRRMYDMALEKYKCTPEQAIMIGDQIMTDIWGANRAGIDSIFVERLAAHEFIGTRVNRQIERVLLKKVYQYFPETGTPQEGRSLKSQLFRFGVIGASSFIINVAILNILMFRIPWGDQHLGQALGIWLREHYADAFRWAATNEKAATPFMNIPATICAIMNSFYWNRKWTFGIVEAEGKARQFAKFLVLSLTGMLWGTLIISLVNNMLHGREDKTLFLATVIATGFVAVWNFMGQRLWAFKK